MRFLERLLTSSTVQKLAARTGYFRLDPSISSVGAKRAALQVHAFLLQSVLKEYAVDCVVDVGANQGQFAAGLRARGYRGAMVSFEPVRDQFEILRRNAEGDPHWHVRADALGVLDEARDIRVMRRPEFTSFLAPLPDQPQAFAGRNEVARTESVSVRRLDGLVTEIPALAQARRILLKMDTQGFDLEVFAGAQALLDRVVALQTELSMVPIYQGMPHFTEALARFEAAGFALCSLVPVTRESDTLALVECDCLMLRRDSHGA